MAVRRGRKTAADGRAVVGIPKRLDPPKHLTKEEKVVWREIVASVPAGHIDKSNAQLLEEYVVQILASRQARQLIYGLPKDCSVKEFAEAVKVQDGISSRIASLATKMRLAQQSTVDRRAAARKGVQDMTAETPWQNLHSMQ